MDESHLNWPEDALILTVNNRLSLELHRAYDRRQAATGLKAWPTPNILPWSAWMLQAYESLLDSGFTQRVLLNPHQERLLWEQVVRSTKTARDLLRPNAAARTAQQAWQRVQDWQLSIEDLSNEASEETLIYLQWQQAFDARCERDRLISSTALLPLLTQAIQQGLWAVPSHMRWTGFDDFSPAQQALLDALQMAGSDVAPLDQSEASQGQVQRFALADSDEEIRRAAHWAKNHIAAHPDAQVAVVSPKLENLKPRIEHLFSQIISPHRLLPGQSGPAGFNVSLGQPLSGFPLVAHLLKALRLCLNTPQQLSDIGLLLRSPFIGGHADEWDKRAQLDFELRNDGLPHITRARLLSRANSFDVSSNAHAPLLIALLQQLQEDIDKLPTEATPNAWAGHLLKLFETFGWPGNRSPDSHEFQQAERLRRVVSEFATLSRVQPHMRFAEALKRFTQLCDDTVFQAQAETTQIQVLGMLEAAGMHFDAIWLMGMDDRAWPPSPSPNPLLPARLQRERNMPHASSQRELTFARHLTHQLLGAAPTINISHAKLDGDQEQRPSPLISELPLIQLAEQTLVDTLIEKARITGQTEQLEQAPYCPPAEPPQGGSHLLSAQAACPFKAVGRYRLKASPLPEPSHAPDAGLLGSLLHELMQRIWQQIGNSEKLQALHKQGFSALVEPLAEATLRDFGRRRPDVFTDAFIRLEKARLSELVCDWLDVEQQRDHAFTIQQLEERHQIDVNGLPLKVQADRIDQLDDGRVLIIDYKTAEKAEPNGWLDQRPTDLQLPLYCIETEQPAAALIARLNVRSMAFRGLAESDNLVPGIKAFAGSDETLENWPQLLDHWRTAINQLAEEIQQGIADVAPQDEKACLYCELSPLCRISSATVIGGEA